MNHPCSLWWCLENSRAVSVWASGPEPKDARRRALFDRTSAELCGNKATHPCPPALSGSGPALLARTPCSGSSVRGGPTENSSRFARRSCTRRLT